MKVTHCVDYYRAKGVIYNRFVAYPVQQTMTRYSALDVMKQASEFYEFSPSEKNYREAMGTIQVYSEDHVMAQTLLTSFRFIANAVYNAYAGHIQIKIVEKIGDVNELKR